MSTVVFPGISRSRECFWLAARRLEQQVPPEVNARRGRVHADCAGLWLHPDEFTQRW